MPSLDIRGDGLVGSPPDFSHPPGEMTGASITPFTHGLTGVNLTNDNISSISLYATIGLICILVLAVRMGQRANSHLRHLTTLSATPEQQTYWKYERGTFWPRLKKNLLYAPLKHKRHNREIQLSTAINVGTIPGRLHTLLLVVYFLSNIAYCCILDYKNDNKAALVAELRGRSGHMATLNMIALFVLAGRNNPFIKLLKVSFDTMNLFHRWIGRIVIFESIIHTLAWAANKKADAGWGSIWTAMHSNPFISWGCLSTIAMVLILVQSPGAIRHAFYETFLHFHQLFAFVTLVGLLAHAKLGPLPQLHFVILIICIWGYDRIYRTLRILYCNFSFTRGWTKVTVEALPGEACRVTFHLPRNWSPPAGSHVYAYLPTVSFWQSHPFSVAWSTSQGGVNDMESLQPAEVEKEKLPPVPQSSTVSLIMSARTGMTRNLYERASKAPTNRLVVYGALEGPYGALESLHSYGTVLLFAGGVGITHNLPHIYDLLKRYEQNTIAIRKIVLIWTVRSTEQLEWVRPWMDEILSMPGRREILKIQLFVTKPRSARDVVSASERVQMFPGRPKAHVIVEKEFSERIGAMCVGVCGPGALADDVRAATREVVDRGKVDFWEEGFTW